MNILFLKTNPYEGLSIKNYKFEPTPKSRFGQKLPDFKNLAVLLRSIYSEL